ncbi:K02A2.6-like [Cordylochernes scorpioides]|uniref:K02A2.6-like n=1 Tax=Cordylochernes scorpioides TaxID=51811 RepID=A0ABY6KS96_9ARAC|nr:K02A2.6-like [Cordylochernes scorpioides]
MVIDTGTNVTLVRTDVFQKLYPKPADVRMNPNSLQTATGKRTELHHCILLSIQIHRGYVMNYHGRVHRWSGCPEAIWIFYRYRAELAADQRWRYPSPDISATSQFSSMPSVSFRKYTTGRNTSMVVNLYYSSRSIKKGSCLRNAEPTVLIKRNHPVMQKSRRADIFNKSGRKHRTSTWTAERTGNNPCYLQKNFYQNLLGELARRQEAETLVKAMLDQNIIEPSSSPWVSPVVLGEIKMDYKIFVDYRKLNDITKKDFYPFPRIDATIDTLAGPQ